MGTAELRVQCKRHLLLGSLVLGHTKTKLTPVGRTLHTA